MSGLRLGASKDILPYTTEDILNADYKLNNFVLGTFGSTAKGLLTGALLSVFFLRKGRVIFYGAGFGAGLNIFHQLKK
jgi:hypothetical protein